MTLCMSPCVNPNPTTSQELPAAVMSELALGMCILPMLGMQRDEPYAPMFVALDA